MGFIGGELGYRVLRRIAKRNRQGVMDGSAFAGRSKLDVLLSPEGVARMKDKSVLDFGCGAGTQVFDLADKGVRRVVGLDIQAPLIADGQREAERRGVTDRVAFTTATDETFDVVVSLDAFEHFSDPAAMLALMHDRLKPGGIVLVSFGPTWYHPLGGHLFSVFPWAHLVFTERALIRWRSDFKTDGARRFSEVQGGLNQMSIRRFETIVRSSPFEIEELQPVPIRKLRAVASPLTREFTTAVVRAVLRKRS